MSEISLFIQDHYAHLIASLKNHGRPIEPLPKEKQVQIIDYWQRLFNQPASLDVEALKQILCLLDFSIPGTSQTIPLLLETLKINNDLITILALGVSQKHILDHFKREGKKVPFEFIQLLEKFLESSNPEVVEWTLRLIEQMGPQSIYFKPKLVQIKPGFKRHFNGHWKACYQIIELLQSRWQAF